MSIPQTPDNSVDEVKAKILFSWRKKLTPPQWYLFAYLIEIADEEGNILSSYRKLSAASGIPLQRLRTALLQLIELKAIQVSKEADDTLTYTLFTISELANTACVDRAVLAPPSLDKNCQPTQSTQGNQHDQPLKNVPVNDSKLIPWDSVEFFLGKKPTQSLNATNTVNTACVDQSSTPSPSPSPSTPTPTPTPVCERKGKEGIYNIYNNNSDPQIRQPRSKFVHIDQLKLTPEMRAYANAHGITHHVEELFEEMQIWANKENKLTKTERGWHAEFQLFVRNTPQMNPRLLDRQGNKKSGSGNCPTCMVNDLDEQNRCPVCDF